MFWFPTRSDTNWAVQLQKMARCLKFRIHEVEGLYYQCSENKGADQLRGYREADLRLCFRICKTLVFLTTWLNLNLKATRMGINLTEESFALGVMLNDMHACLVTQTSILNPLMSSCP